MRLIAIVVLLIAIATILVGRLGHHNPIAIAGYVVLAIAVILGLLSRRI